MPTKKTAGRTTDKTADGFTKEERAAMKERAAEVRAAKRRGASGGKADGESDLLAKIAEMSDGDRTMAERVHAVVTASAPELESRTWYGMPAYARDGKVVCFFQPADKFKARYSTLGFNDPAKLDDGNMWPTTFALTKVTKAVEKEIGALVKRAMG